MSCQVCKWSEERTCPNYEGEGHLEREIAKPGEPHCVGCENAVKRDWSREYSYIRCLHQSVGEDWRKAAVFFPKVCEVMYRNRSAPAWCPRRKENKKGPDPRARIRAGKI